MSQREAPPADARGHRGALLTVLTLLVVLAVAVEYAKLRARYDWVYSWYATVTDRLPPGTPVNIGPSRVVLAFERPWAAALLQSRPLPQTAAEFLLRAIRLRVNPAHFLYGPGLAFADPAAALKGFVAGQAAWEVDANPLWAGNSKIPYNSDLVQGYFNQVVPAPGRRGDLSLWVLWLRGYEEYVRQRFTGAATSVLAEWNYMYALDAPDPLPADNGCNALSMVGSFVSSGIAGAGVGAMVGAPEGGPIGAGVGAAIGFLIGGAGSLLGKTQCL